MVYTCICASTAEQNIAFALWSVIFMCVSYNVGCEQKLWQYLSLRLITYFKTIATFRFGTY